MTMVFRRLNRAFEEMQSGTRTPIFLPLPDLILVDGGETHVNTVLSVIGSFGFDIAVAGLVKDSKHRLRGLILPDGRELNQDSFKYARKPLNDISEEVHRFAIEYHRLSRSKRMLKSELESIEGIGPKKASLLMESFGTLDSVRQASVEELTKVEGISTKNAESIREHFSEQ